MRDEKEERKQGQTNKAKQHSTPKAVTFPKKKKLPQVGLEPTTLYTLDRALYHMYMYNYIIIIIILYIHTEVSFPPLKPKIMPLPVARKPAGSIGEGFVVRGCTCHDQTARLKQGRLWLHPHHTTTNQTSAI